MGELSRKITGTYAVLPQTVAAMMLHLERTAQTVRMNRSGRDGSRSVYDRYTIRGVQGRLVDVIIQRSIADRLPDVEAGNAWHQAEPDRLLTVETVSKAGKYDGARRLRLCVRWTSAATQRGEAIPARVRILPEPDADSGPQCRIMIRPRDRAEHGDPREWSFPLHRSITDQYPDGFATILRWHYHRYFSWFGLRDDELMLTAAEWEAVERDALASATLAEANRSAERYLYRIARDSGWIKTTLGQRLRLWGESGRAMGPWLHETQVLQGYLDRYGYAPEWIASATGCGEATLRAAAPTTEGFLPDAAST